MALDTRPDKPSLISVGFWNPHVEREGRRGEEGEEERRKERKKERFLLVPQTLEAPSPVHRGGGPVESLPFSYSAAK